MGELKQKTRILKCLLGIRLCTCRPTGIDPSPHQKKKYVNCTSRVRTDTWLAKKRNIMPFCMGIILEWCRRICASTSCTSLQCLPTINQQCLYGCVRLASLGRPRCVTVAFFFPRMNVGNYLHTFVLERIKRHTPWSTQGSYVNAPTMDDECN